MDVIFKDARIKKATDVNRWLFLNAMVKLEKVRNERNKLQFQAIYDALYQI